MSDFPYAPRDIAVEMFVNSGWVDITTDVYRRDRIKISRGRANESTQAGPVSCSLTLDNRTGKYSPRNPAGTYYGSLGRNTPLRLAIRTAKDAFGRTVAAGWGTADVGGAWTHQGTGSGQYAVGSGVATHTQAVAGVFLLSYLGAQLYRDVDLAATVTLPFSDVTGGILEPLNLCIGGQSLTDYFISAVTITAAEAVTIGINRYDGTVLVAQTPTGITFTGQALRSRFQLDGQTLRAKVWVASGPEPYAWNVEVGATTMGPILARRAPGWVGIRSTVGGGNTNVPVVFSYDNFEVRSNRFTGEVSNWPVAWDLSGEDVYSQITASGILRRLGQGESQLKSTYLRGNQTITPPHIGYWPVEDGTDSTSIASGIGGNPMVLSGAASQFASNSDFPGSKPIGKPNRGRWWGNVSGAADTGQVQAIFLLSVPSTGEIGGAALIQLETTGTAGFYTLSYGTGGTLTLTAFDRNRLSIYSAGPLVFAVDGRPLQVSLELTQAGADINWSIAILAPGDAAGVVLSNTIPGRTVGAPTGLGASPYTEVGSSAIGHLAMRNSITSIYTLANQLKGYSGETARSRMNRICDENGIPFSYRYNGLTSSTPVGAQPIASVLSVIGEAAAADLGSLYETRSNLGMAYRIRNELVNQVATLALNYNTGDLAPPFSPVDDDQNLRNSINVTRTKGSSYQATQTTGPLAVTAPGATTGVGLYDDSITLNLATDTQVPDVAGWLLHLGTVNEARYPQIKINLAKLATTAYPAQLSLDALAVDVDHRITIDNPKAGLPPDQITQLVRGYTEELNGFEHTLVFNCAPESPYQVVRLDDTARGKLNTITSTLAKPATSTDTKLLVTDGASPGWTTNPAALPIPLQIAGERVSVTAVAAAGPTFVAAGVAATGNNASLVAAHPAGLQVGDLKLIFTSIRNSGTGFVAFPAGWEQVFGSGNFAVLWRYHETGDVAPTVTFVNGVANADTIVQMAAFRGCSATKLIDQTQLNVSAQNIAYPACPISKNNALVLYLGWKQDDWTSVATLAGATEIGEPSSTAGDDSAMVWDYLIQTTKADIPSGSFVVTGGASAISRGAVVVLDGNVQAMTVTRSVNGVVKTQAAGAQVKLARPATLAL